MQRIYDLCGVGRECFDAMYVPAAEQMAAYVQSLPASEYHHHARVDGLLDHALGTAASALQLRQAFLLPPDAEPEQVRRRGDVWTYGVYLAGLFHDIGKAATDHEVELLNENGDSVGNWSALRGPMASTHYRAKFRETRRYQDHQKLGAIVMRPLLPEAALDWLFSDTELTIQLIEFLSGDKSGVLSRIIRDADMSSVRHDVSNMAVPSASNPISLPEQFLSAFRELIESGALPNNKPGAGVWITETYVWLVAKRAIDSARDHLRVSAAFKAPKDNFICMDELQAGKICLATPDGKAIWRMTISDNDWIKTLSLLKVPTDKLWPVSAQRPPVFTGTVSAPVNPQVAGPPAVSGERLLSNTAEIEDSDPAKVANEKQPPTPAAVSNTHPEASVRKDENLGSDRTYEEQEPERFYQWLIDGVVSGRLPINVKDALIHSVDDGLLLISPRIFKLYAQRNDTDWKRVQRKVIKQTSLLRPKSGSNIVEYSVSGERKSSVVKGLVVMDVQSAIGLALPSPNKYLKRLTPCFGLD